jgi:hypothetical protein
MTMRSKIKKDPQFNKLKLLLMLLIFTPLFASCGMHYNIKGKVIDARTGEPVEGAVVAINWIRYKIAPPGLPTPKERYGTAEDLTDAQGVFTIPKYPIGTHYMGVYKSGYVCWSSDRIFNPQGKTDDERIIHHWEKISNGMVVKLEPKTIDFPEVKHASFVSTVGIRLSSPKPKFNDATKEERSIEMEYIRRRMKGKMQ